MQIQEKQMASATCAHAESSEMNMEAHLVSQP